MSALKKSISNGFLGRAFAVIGAATAASAAVEARRSPSARHLTQLGIDPAAFERIRDI